MDQINSIGPVQSGAGLDNVAKTTSGLKEHSKLQGDLGQLHERRQFHAAQGRRVDQ